MTFILSLLLFINALMNETEQEKILHYPLKIIIFCPIYDTRRGVLSAYYKNSL
jgi:hypothetical protein